MPPIERYILQVGGYLITEDEAKAWLHRRGYSTFFPKKNISRNLNKRFKELGLDRSMQAMRVLMPDPRLKLRKENGQLVKVESMVLLRRKNRGISKGNPAVCIPFKELEKDEKVKRFLEKEGFDDLHFVTIVDPWMQYKFTKEELLVEKRYA